MVKTEMYPIERKMSDEDLNRLIKSLERSARVLKKLLFIRYRYDGDSVESASKKIGITKMMGYLWQKRWNQHGYKGLLPKYARKGPSKMSDDQKEILKEKLKNEKRAVHKLTGKGYHKGSVWDRIYHEAGMGYIEENGHETCKTLSA